MAKLPTRDDLSAAPSARSGRPIATYDVATPLQRGANDLGRGLQQFGAALADIAQHQEAVDEAETDKKFQEFKWSEEQARDEAMRNVEPGKAGTFANDWQAGYKTRAREFLSTLPEGARARYDNKLFATERDLFRPAAEFARREQKRAAENGLDDFRERYAPRSGDPGAVERFKADYEGLVDRSPWLTPIEKDERKRKGFRDIEATHVTSLLSDRGKAREVLRDMGFGADIEAAPAEIAPEEQASKGVSGAQPGQPQAPAISADAASALISTQLETGKKNPLEGVASIARDSAGTKSYGNFGLNSGGSAQKFAAEYGASLGLAGEPGTAEFDRSWRAAAVRDPEALHQAEMAWYSRNITATVGKRLVNAGVDEVLANDPRVQAYFADRSIQQGAGSIDEMNKHRARIKAAADEAGGDPAKFLKNITEADRAALTSDFPTALRTGVYSERGHDNRLDGRLRLALGVSGDGAKLPSSPDTYTGPYRHLTAEDRLRFATAARTALKQEAAETRDAVRDFETVAEQGFAPQAGQLDALRQRVEMSGDPETRASFAQAESIMKWQDVARKAAPAELDNFIRQETERLRTTGATPFDVKRLGMADKLLANMRQGLKSDPLGWADRVGFIQVQPVDFSSPETAKTSLGLRVQQADGVARRYGVEPKYLRDDEKQALTNAIEQGGDGALDAVGRVAHAAGERARDIFAEVSKNSPTAAIIGGMVTEVGMSGAARDAVDGLALRREPGFQSVAPSKSETRSAVTSVLGSSLSGMPKTETAIIDATNAVYEVRARKQQLTSFDSGVWQQALREVIGERQDGGKTYGGIVDADPAWRGGRSIIIPPFVSKDEWGQVIDTMNAVDFEKAGLSVPIGGDGKLVPMSRIRGGILVQSGDGRYKVSLGNPDLPGEEKWVFRKDAPGEIFEIDLHALRPLLSERRPDLFIGAPARQQPDTSSMTGFETGD